MACKEDKSVQMPPCKEDPALRKVMSKEILFCFLWEFLSVDSSLAFRQGKVRSCSSSVAQIPVVESICCQCDSYALNPPCDSKRAFKERWALPETGCATLRMFISHISEL